jgi:hypothetical protein
MTWHQYINAQLILLYGSETWVMAAAREKNTLQSFHQECARYVMGKHIRPDPTTQKVKHGICPPSEDTILEEAGFILVQHYIVQRRNTIQSYATSRPIYESCLHSKKSNS